MTKEVICNDCLEHKKHEAFGLCRKCYLKYYHRKWRKKPENKIKCLKSVYKWQKEHPKEFRKIQKRYENKDKEKWLEYHRIIIENIERISKARRKIVRREHE